jgi:hypothetical protein
MSTAEIRHKPQPTDGARRFSATRLVLSLGGLAGAVTAMLTLTGTVQSWFDAPPEGRVSELAIQRVTPLNYGEWRRHERAGTKGVPRDQLRLPGRMITYNVDTVGYEKNTTLPVRLILYDETTERSTHVEGNEIRVIHGADCGCADWLETPHRGHRYAIEIEIYPPGPIRGNPLRTLVTESFEVA